MGEAEDGLRETPGDGHGEVANDTTAKAGDAGTSPAGDPPAADGANASEAATAAQEPAEAAPAAAATAAEATAAQAPGAAAPAADADATALPAAMPWVPAWIPGQRRAVEDAGAAGDADGAPGVPGAGNTDGDASTTDTADAADAADPPATETADVSGAEAAVRAIAEGKAPAARRRSFINPWIAGAAACLLVVAGGALVQSPFEMVSARQVPTSDLPRLSDPAPPESAGPVNGGGPSDLALPPVLPAAAPGASGIPTGPQPIPSLTPQGIPVPQGAGAYGIPQTVLAAYQQSAATMARLAPGCHLPWELLAGIGKVESGHANAGNVGADGTTITPILGPRLDGRQFALIRDTDGGRYDGDREFDRAVGPMQFIPSTWKSWGMDANRDGRADPQNIYDATLAAGRYLCAGGRDLNRPAALEAAILSYNRSREYLQTVLSWMSFYRSGVRPVPDSTRPPTQNTQTATRPATSAPTGSTTRPATTQPATSQPASPPPPSSTPPPSPGGTGTTDATGTTAADGSGS